MLMVVAATLMVVTQTSPLHPAEVAPTQSVEALYAALRDEKCEQAFGMLTAESQLRFQLVLGSISNYCAVAATAWPLQGRPLKVAVVSSRMVPGNGALVRVRLTLEGSTGDAYQEMTHYLVRECGAWKFIDKAGVAAAETAGR